MDERQKKFADLYIQTGNASESYQRAGYKAKGNAAEAAASRLLRNVKVIEYMKERNKQLENDRIAGMEEVKEFWTNTMRSEVAELKDRLKASEYIAKTNAAFIDKVETKGEVTYSIKLPSDLNED